MRTLIISILLYAWETWNRITYEDQSRWNEMLPPPFAHFMQRPHHKWNSMHENTSSHRSLRTVKKGSYDGSDMWSYQVASAKRSRNAQYQGKEKEEGKRKDRKTASESGPVSTSTAVREQPKTVRDGIRWSPMSIVVPLRPWWCRDTGNNASK